MQFFKSLSILALAAQSLAELTQYQLFAKSDDKEIDGNGIYYINEGDNISYFFISNGTDAPSASTITYDDENQEFYHQVSPEIKCVLTNTHFILQLTATSEPMRIPIDEDGVIDFGSSYQLYAVKDFGDHYGYSKDNYGILFRKLTHGIPISIEARKDVSS
ncbi:hypothetical protein CANMA_001889 [Candida margitis]|uniref:uncharacterized protein n=1 Tax=Candida margitis TaxID=1775924 RepID=UPI002227D728|nr:uncharacterized protein CANMA_001889 [Candida margitis]KAI5969084.1 hypothetical protein CANMA_001889 [Candida margitis]